MLIIFLFKEILACSLSCIKHIKNPNLESTLVGKRAVTGSMYVQRKSIEGVKFPPLIGGGHPKGPAKVIAAPLCDPLWAVTKKWPSWTFQAVENPSARQWAERHQHNLGLFSKKLGGNKTFHPVSSYLEISISCNKKMLNYWNAWYSTQNG